MKAISPLMMAAALAATPVVGACQTVPKRLNINSCSYDNAKKATGITGLFQSIVPSFRTHKPSQPCLYANDFMALVDVVYTGENIKNHYITGAVVSSYEELQRTKGKFARETLNLIDIKLKNNNLTIDMFRALRDQYGPHEQSRNEERNCTLVTIQEFGRLEDRRLCRSAEAVPLPQ